MIRNYLLSAWGNARKNSGGLAINLFGLAMSLSALILIVLFIRREYNYDKAHANYERIYRITEVINSGSYIENSSSSPYPVKDALENDFSEQIESITRVFDFQIPEKSVKLENNELYLEKGIYYADSTFFQVFNFPLLVGNPASVLDKPFSMVLSRELAQKWFPNEDPLGKTIKLAGNDKLACEVTGVFDSPYPSHIKPRAIISMSTTRKMIPWLNQNWVWNPCWTYIKFKENTRISEFEAQLPAFVEKNYPEFVRHMVKHELQPIASIHLNSKLEFEMSKNGDKKHLYIFICSALFLLIVAAINYINLNSIYFMQRIREFGVRKVSGALPSQINFQLIVESVAMAQVAFIGSMILLAVFYPMISHFLQFEIELIDLFKPGVLLLLQVVVLIVGVVAGLLPGHLVSSFDVVTVFKSGMKGSKKGKTLRKTLVVFQFTLAIALMTFTIMAGKQLSFMQSRNNGFDADNILVMRIVTTQVQGKFDAFRQELMQHPGVIAATPMNEKLGIRNNNHEFRYGDMKEGEWKYFPALMVDEYALQTFGIEMLAGRPYSPDYKREDSLSIVINQAMAEYLGYSNPQDAIGKKFVAKGGNERIVGVTPNFNFKTLHQPVGPFVLDVTGVGHGKIHFSKYAAVRVANKNPETLAHIQKVWEKYVKSAPFDYQILGDEISQQYASENRMSKVLAGFSVLSVVIACLGLFALTWFMSQAKSKELAIRQVAGAPFSTLLKSATREQMIMVFMAIGVGIPLSLVGIQRWLEGFAFRISQDPLVYIVIVTLAVLIAFFTILYHAWKVSIQNPATVLKYD